MSRRKTFLIGAAVGFVGASALPLNGLAALFACLINGVVWGVFFLGMHAMAGYFSRQQVRDHARAEAEGVEAVTLGRLPESNPYLGEKSDYFKGMAQAWFRGYVSKNTNATHRGDVRG